MREKGAGRRIWPEEETTYKQLGSRCGTVGSRLASLASPSSAGLEGRLGSRSRSPSSAVLAKVFKGSFLGLPRTPQTLPGRKLEPILPYLPALTSFEDGTEEPWEGVHLPVTLTSTIKVI